MGIDLYNLVISAKLQKGGGGDIEIDALDVTENGVYSASSGHAFDPVVVSVPTGVFPSGTSSITANGIYDITNFASVDVNVSGGGGHDNEDGLIERTISSLVNSTAMRIGSSAFQGDKVIEFVSFKNASVIGASAFAAAESLHTAIFDYAGSISIGSSAFQNCKSLMSLYFLGNSVGTFKTNALFYTPMSSNQYTGSYGSIYVTASLVDTYKSAAGWSAYASRITSYVE